MKRRTFPLVASLFAAALLAGCETTDPSTVAPESAADVEATAPSIADLLPDPNTPADRQARITHDEPTSAPIPHIYLALQPGGAGNPHSAVFAIDAARDGTPSDDPAMRLTPEGGRCNPQELRRYEFPPDAAPLVSEAERERGLTARDLPAFLAAQVTGRMIEARLAAEPEDTRPLNICTRKLWERLVVAENREALAAGQ